VGGSCSCPFGCGLESAWFRRSRVRGSCCLMGGWLEGEGVAAPVGASGIRVARTYVRSESVRRGPTL
jgi:hypothetical protein